MLRMYACVNLFGLGFLPVAASWFSPGQGLEPIYTAFTDTLTLSARTPMPRIQMQFCAHHATRNVHDLIKRYLSCCVWLPCLRHLEFLETWHRDRWHLQFAKTLDFKCVSLEKRKCDQGQSKASLNRHYPFFFAAVCLSDFLESHVSNFRGKHCHWISTYIYIYPCHDHDRILTNHFEFVVSYQLFLWANIGFWWIWGAPI